MSTVNDKQVAGSHYRSTIQHWDFVLANGLGYLEGQITKYVTRWRQKNGVEDLLKAKHFLDKLIEHATSNDIKGELEAKGEHEEQMRAMELEDAQHALTYLLQHHIFSEDGQFTFPDGTTYGCAKVAKVSTDTVLRHHSTTRFNMEGMKENYVMYRCRLCREHFNIAFTQSPEQVHTQCGRKEESAAEELPQWGRSV